MAEKAKAPARRRTTKKESVVTVETVAVAEVNNNVQDETPAPAIIPEVLPPVENVTGGDEILTLSIDDVYADPDQPRKTFDAADLSELGNNIKENGQLLPVRVSLNPDIPGQYILEDGERRYRACLKSGIKTIKAIVVPAKSPAERLVLQMSANTGKPLLPMETANGYKRLSDTGWSNERIAQSFGVSKQTVEMDLMLTACHPTIQAAVDRGFSKTVARRLSTITNMAEQMGAFERAEKCENDKKRLAAIEAYTAKKAQTSGVLGEVREATPGDIEDARKVWGSFKSGYAKFAKLIQDNKGTILVGPAMKSNAHRLELEKTAKDLKRAAEKLLSDLDAYNAAINQERPLDKAA